MRIEREQPDRARPGPQLLLRDGYHAIGALVRMGGIPIGDVMVRPVRTRVASHRRLRKRISDRFPYAIVRTMMKQALAAGPDALVSDASVLCSDKLAASTHQ